MPMSLMPDPNILRMFRSGASVDYKLLLAEGIDNAFDAGATRIDIRVDDEEISFLDNGCGVTLANFEALFKLGRHKALLTTQIGIFGVGIKAQAIPAGDVLTVDSISKDGRYVTSVNWVELQRKGDWRADDPQRRPLPVGKGTGTKVIISKLRSRPKTTTLAKLATEVAEVFFPAIAEGKKVLLNGEPIDALAEPGMTDSIDVKLNFSGSNRGAVLRAGILTEKAKRLSGVNIGYHHRIIQRSSAFGCGDYAGCIGQMFARLQLYGQWTLSTFKNKLTDEAESDELEDAVATALEPILAKCAAQSMTTAVADMTALVNSLVPSRMRPQKKKPRGEPGAKDHSTTHGRGKVNPRKAEPTSTGPATGNSIDKKRQPKLEIVFVDGLADEAGLGELRPGGRTDVVALAKDDPTVAGYLRYRDKGYASRALAYIGLSIYEAEKKHPYGQQDFDFWSFGKRMATHLALDDGTVKSDELA